MGKDEIRIQYSGFVIFGSQMVSVITGLIFTLLLTRNMSEAEFGIWSNIFDYTAYFTRALRRLLPPYTMASRKSSYSCGVCDGD